MPSPGGLAIGASAFARLVNVPAAFVWNRQLCSTGSPSAACPGCHASASPAAVNMARARSEGVPALNVFRRQLFNRTNDSQLQPYTSWVDFGENIKHPESLVNFVAAYGQHPTILADAGADGQLVNDPDTEADESADNGPATLESRREAARRLVNPVLGEANIPADASPATAVVAVAAAV